MIHQYPQKTVEFHKFRVLQDITFKAVQFDTVSVTPNHKYYGYVAPIFGQKGFGIQYLVQEEKCRNVYDLLNTGQLVEVLRIGGERL